MYSSQSPWCSGQPELKHELLLQTHPANNHPEANRKRSPAQTLELQFLSSTLKSFWRGVSQCLWVPPAPGKSAVMLGLAGSPGHFTPLPLHPPEVWCPCIWGTHCLPPHRGHRGCSSSQSARQLSLDWR